MDDLHLDHTEAFLVVVGLMFGELGQLNLVGLYAWGGAMRRLWQWSDGLRGSGSASCAGPGRWYRW